MAPDVGARRYPHRCATAARECCVTSPARTRIPHLGGPRARFGPAYWPTRSWYLRVRAREWSHRPSLFFAAMPYFFDENGRDLPCCLRPYSGEPSRGLSVLIPTLIMTNVRSHSQLPYFNHTRYSLLKYDYFHIKNVLQALFISIF